MALLTVEKCVHRYVMCTSAVQPERDMIRAAAASHWPNNNTKRSPISVYWLWLEELVIGWMIIHAWTCFAKQQPGKARQKFLATYGTVPYSLSLYKRP